MATTASMLDAEKTGLPDCPQRAVELSEILRAVAHPLRLRLIAMLCEGEAHVGAMAERLEAAPAIVSQQLGILRGHRLVSVERRAGHAVYRLREERLRELVHCMDGCRTH